MKILIAGDGETGTHLAEMLSVEGQDVTLLGSNRDRLQELDSTSNFMTAIGCATAVDSLQECGVAGVDLFVAVTPDENVNLVACELAKGCGARRCVARVDNPQYGQTDVAAMLKNNGVDQTIYPERMVAETALHFIRHNWATDWFRLHNGKLLVVGVRVAGDDAFAGRTLRELASSPKFFHVAVIKRGGNAIIPRGDDRVLPGDTLYISLLPSNVGMLHDLCGRNSTKINKIMITGAGRVTENLLRLLESRGGVTVIDPDRARCREMAFKFPDAVIVNARSNDVVTMKDEGIEGCDMFLALTGSSEANIVSCMVAREHGVKKTLARIEEFQYMEEAESLAIDKIVNKKQLNTGMVMNMLLDSEMATTQCLATDKAEVTVMVAGEDSKIVSRPICELSLPQGLTIAGLVRGGEGQLVEGRTHVRPGDHVVVFFLTGSLQKVKRLFR
jgi:trk system potassium uptake protein TrkA